MQLKNYVIRSTLLGFLLAGIGGCAHGPSIQEFPSTANPAEEVQKFDQDMNQARLDQADVLSPMNYDHAKDNLERSKKYMDAQKDPRDILSQVAEGRAYLGQARQFTEVSELNISDVSIARKQAVSAGANSLYSDDFTSVDKSLKDVTSQIEKNNTDPARKKRGELQASFLALELRAIKQNRLGQARETVALAVKEGAEKFAPRTLAQTQKKVTDADAYIIANRHDNAELTEQSTQVLTAANHLLKITRDAKAGKKTSAEDSALNMEAEQQKVGEKQKELTENQQQLLESEKNLDAKKGELAGRSKELRASQEVNQAMATEQATDQAFKKVFDDAQKEFSPSEAQVYQQGNTIVIRLRALQFPVSQASLGESNFPLLAKVQKIINDSGKGSVLIEGHTDSQGGKALNEKLSMQRAEAVKQYLVSNQGQNPLNVSAKGFGDQKPLASNKTASGRAQNRRVDVRISREAQSSTSNQ